MRLFVELLMWCGGGALDFNSNLSGRNRALVSPLKRTSDQSIGGEMALTKKDLSEVPKQYRRCIDDLHDSLNTIIQILSEIEDKTWRRKLAGMCMLALGMLEFPETSLQDITEGEENYIG